MQEKTAVVYKSKYGGTERYAKWICNDVKGDLFRITDVTVGALEKYSTIVYCGGLYAGRIAGISFIKKNFESLSKKKITVVAVGSGLATEEMKKKVLDSNLSADIKSKINFFLLRGDLNLPKMNFLDKFIMNILTMAMKLKKGEERDQFAKDLISAKGKKLDLSEKDTIKPIVKLIRGK